MDAKWLVEYTDTYGGEANYSWVRRDEIPLVEGEPTRSTARRAKAAMGVTGLKGRSCWNGDHYEFRPHRCATVLLAYLQY